MPKTRVQAMVFVPTSGLCRYLSSRLKLIASKLEHLCNKRNSILGKHQLRAHSSLQRPPQVDPTRKCFRRNRHSPYLNKLLGRGLAPLASMLQPRQGTARAAGSPKQRSPFLPQEITHFQPQKDVVFFTGSSILCLFLAS